MPSPESRFSTQFSRQQASEIAFSAAIGAGLMLFVGFFFNLKGIGNSDFYDLSVDGFTWMMKIGGALMAVVAALLWAGLRPALLVDAILTLALGLLMLIIGAVWMAFRDYQGILLLIFGAIYLRSGWGSWAAFRGINAGYAFPVAPPIDTSTVPPVEAADPVARQAAMDRLLASKKREAMPEPEPIPEPVAPPPAPKAADLPRPPVKVRSLAKEEPPPDGFLAELGRDDSKRK
jgi:hypothetical protein